MKDQTADAAIGLITSAGLAALFLPNISQAWDADPGTHEGAVTRKKITSGAQLYAGFVAALATFYAIRSRSPVPFVIGAGVVGAVLWQYQRALYDPETA